MHKSNKQCGLNIKTSEKKQTENIKRKFVNKPRFINAKPKVSNAIETKLRSSKKERRVDALALRAEERRDKLRKAAGRSKYPSIRRYPNGETRMRSPHTSIRQSITYGREPSELKHLSNWRKRKKTRFPE